MARNQIHLAGYLLSPASHFVGQWRHPLSAANFLDRKLWESIGRTLEQGRFDLAFIPDLLGVPEKGGTSDPLIRRGSRGVIQLEPTQALAVVAGATTHLGVGATLSSTYFPPYQLARTLGSLDHLSGGRVAWNIVTTADNAAAKNFGFDHVPEHDSRYDRADEVVDVVTRLWASWQDDALQLDREGGVFADPDKVHRLNHEGRWLKVRGPLTLPPTPQGRPILMQAGVSSRGRDFAARWAEAIFLIQASKESLIEVRTDIRERAKRLGRDPDGIKFIAAVQPVVGETEAVARAKQEALSNWTDPDVARALLADFLGPQAYELAADTSADELRRILGPRGKGATEGYLLLESLGKEGATLGQIAQRYAETHLTPQLVGTPAQIADVLEDFYTAEAVDGFVITPTTSPGSFEDFVRGVVPELQRRGLHRTEYEHSTLRGHLGLPDPAPIDPRVPQVAQPERPRADPRSAEAHNPIPVAVP